MNWNAMDDETFRREARSFFETHYPPELRHPSRRLRWHEIKSWYLTLSRHGWLAPAWPIEHGGMGLTPAKLVVLIEEQERWGVARTPDMGVTMVGPLLLQHGSAEQKSRYLPQILAGTEIWCQGYSEPNAGSDLANLGTEAVLDGGEFVLNGQKIWTTLAQDATHMFLLARTNKTAKKQEGISFLLLDLKTKGITIRPIRNIAGEEEFCEVFFDDVRLPRENLVGKLDGGWTVAKALLGFERIFIGNPRQAQYALKRLEAYAQASGAADDTAFVDRYTQLTLDVADLESLYGSFVDALRNGSAPGPDISILKIWATETSLRIANLMLEVSGSSGAILRPASAASCGADPLRPLYGASAATIYSGTNEIQRNIVAKSVLRLPS